MHTAHFISLLLLLSLCCQVPPPSALLLLKTLTTTTEHSQSTFPANYVLNSKVKFCPHHFLNVFTTVCSLPAHWLEAVCLTLATERKVDTASHACLCSWLLPSWFCSVWEQHVRLTWRLLLLLTAEQGMYKKTRWAEPSRADNDQEMRPVAVSAEIWELEIVAARAKLPCCRSQVT